MVILKKENETLGTLNQEEISRRLYRLRRIFDPNKGLLQLQYHLESRNDKSLAESFPQKEFGKAGTNGFSQIDYTSPWPRLLLSLGNQNFWIEGKDFIIKNGKVIAIS